MNALLIRHAATTGQAPDAPLTDEGLAQADALVADLTTLGAGPLYSSPFKRAGDTIAPYAQATGQQVTMLEGLRERLLSPTPLDDWLHHIQASFDDPSHAAPGGESHADLIARAALSLSQIERAGGALPAFVTHGALTTALFNQVDPRFGYEDWRALRNPDLFAVTLSGGKVTGFARVDLPVGKNRSD